MCILLLSAHIVIFTVESLTQPCTVQIHQHHFPNSICLLCVCMPHFDNCCNISNFHYRCVSDNGLWLVIFDATSMTTKI